MLESIDSEIGLAHGYISEIPFVERWKHGGNSGGDTKLEERERAETEGGISTCRTPHTMLGNSGLRGCVLAWKAEWEK